MSRPRFDRTTVEHTAKLACLTLSEDEATRFAAELAAIVAYVDELDALDTKDVPPTFHCVPAHEVSGQELAASTPPLRPDVVEDGLSHEAALGQAPRKHHGGFAVPAFVES